MTVHEDHPITCPCPECCATHVSSPKDDDEAERRQFFGVSLAFAVGGLLLCTLGVVALWGWPAGILLMGAAFLVSGCIGMIAAINR